MINQSNTIESFVKGRIVELLFEMMMREDQNKTFTVIPFGYEKTTPELAQYRELIKNTDTLNVIRQSPDFILIKNDKTNVYFVEVKYRKHLSRITKNGLLVAAKNISQYWKDTWMFVATQDGFFFDSCAEIIRTNGEVCALNDKVISPEIQRKYTDVLKKFIKVEKKELIKV